MSQCIERESDRREIERMSRLFPEHRRLGLRRLRSQL